MAGTRFDVGNKAGAFYKHMYDKPDMHAAVRKLQQTCTAHGMLLSEAALRWLYFHSALEEGDGIILGVSKLAQLQQNTDGIAAGPLPPEVIEMFEQVWREVEAEAPK